MRTRKIPFIQGEYYHVFNRGIDKRDIFSDQYDIKRFVQSMNEFNNVEPIGSIYQNSFNKTSLRGRTPKSNTKSEKLEKLVDFICYCLNPNHYHFMLSQISDNGISEFMRRLNGGYTSYFNHKNHRSGPLFQGCFKAKHIDSNEYLLHVSAYINLNDSVHKLRGSTPKCSSFGEYVGAKRVTGICNKDIILGQFESPKKYAQFAQEALEGILERRKTDKELIRLLLE